MHTIAGPRGCGGSRTEGGIYMETAVSPFGEPVEAFLACPPIPIDPEAIGLAPQGVILVDDPDGVTHVIDWVGSTHYPNVADFVEEVRRLGPSRKLSRNLDFGRLSRGSHMVLVHARAIIDNYGEYGHLPKDCPSTTHGSPPAEMCAALWWKDVDPSWSKVEVEAQRAAGTTTFTRTIPSGEYSATLRPEGVVPVYRPGIFARFPITNLSVVRANDGSHEQAIEAVRGSGIGYSVDDE